MTWTPMSQVRIQGRRAHQGDVELPPNVLAVLAVTMIALCVLGIASADTTRFKSSHPRSRIRGSVRAIRAQDGRKSWQPLGLLY